MDKFPHPAARILLWCGWAAAVELVAAPELPILAVAAATAFVFARARNEGLRLLRRTRWLLAVLVLTYALAVPGAPLWPGLDWASPTMEGLAAGGLRAARLVLLLAGLAVLLAFTPRPRLIYGLYVLAAPLARVGFDRRAFVVRLGLTLDHVERGEARPLGALAAPMADDGTPTTYRLEGEAWRGADHALVAAGALLVSIAALT